MPFSNFSTVRDSDYAACQPTPGKRVSGAVKIEQKHLSGNATYQESGAERLVGNSELEIRP